MLQEAVRDCKHNIRAAGNRGHASRPVKNKRSMSTTHNTISPHTVFQITSRMNATLRFIDMNTQVKYSECNKKSPNQQQTTGLQTLGDVITFFLIPSDLQVGWSRIPAVRIDGYTLPQPWTHRRAERRCFDWCFSILLKTLSKHVSGHFLSSLLSIKALNYCTMLRSLCSFMFLELLQETFIDWRHITWDC